MTAIDMYNDYEKFAKHTKYIIGFVYKHNLYAYETKHIKKEWLYMTACSRNQGYALRLMMNADEREKLSKSKKAHFICKDKELIQPKYNKGEIFEKMMTEQYGQEWKKDNVPFYRDGDLRVKKTVYQIKLNTATFCNTSQLKWLNELTEND